MSYLTGVVDMGQGMGICSPGFDLNMKEYTSCVHIVEKSTASTVGQIDPAK